MYLKIALTFCNLDKAAVILSDTDNIIINSMKYHSVDDNASNYYKAEVCLVSTQTRGLKQSSPHTYLSSLKPSKARKLYYDREGVSIIPVLYT